MLSFMLSSRNVTFWALVFLFIKWPSSTQFLNSALGKSRPPDAKSWLIGKDPDAGKD